MADALQIINECYESQLITAEQRGYERAKKDAARHTREMADAIRKANTYRGRVNDNAEQAAVWCEEIATDIEEMNTEAPNESRES